MNITKIELFNIRCYEKLEIDCTNDDNIVKWITILGDNGTGKSTLLKCIALGLCDITSAAGLLREIPWKLRNDKEGKKPGVIKIHLTKGRRKFKIETTIKPLYGKGKDQRIETIERLILNSRTGKQIEDKGFNWDEIFICGYGASRNAEGTTDYSNYSIVDAVYTLFRYDQPLQNPELAMRRYMQRSKDKGKIKRADTLKWLNELLDPILLLDSQEKITLEEDGIWVKSNVWGKVPLGATGDGYKATLTWVMDFISWASYFYNEEIIDNNIEGIVLIDEIEQHLHPKWQRYIVSVLRDTFRNVQFISTTHSPLVTINTVKIGEEEKSKLYSLAWNEKRKVESSLVQEQVADLGFDQILGSEAFGHIFENPKLANLLREMSDLASIDNPKKEHSDRLFKINSMLKKIMFPMGTSLIEREATKNYRNELMAKNKELRAILSSKKK